jgi:hypothetical protein
MMWDGFQRAQPDIGVVTRRDIKVEAHNLSAMPRFWHDCFFCIFALLNRGRLGSLGIKSLLKLPNLLKLLF